MAAICILTSTHLCRNPRVVKEAAALSEAGYRVTVLGPIFSEELATQDAELSKSQNYEYRAVVDLRRNLFQRFNLRAIRRVALEVNRFLKLELAQSLGYGATQMLRAAQHENWDLYIGHTELGAWVAYELAKKGCRVGVDFEDWYSEDLLPRDRIHRPLKLLKKCEHFLLKHSVHVTTTSNAMSEALAERYGVSKPAVIYNCFPWADRSNLDGEFKDRKDKAVPSLHWVSQTIGPGRGLEILCEALRKISIRVQIHLRGTFEPETKKCLLRMFPAALGHALHFRELVHPKELLSRIAEHDIGLALEPNIPENKNLTVSNKFFHYLLGGLAVVATNTDGQREIGAGTSPAVHLCGNGDSDNLADKIRLLLENPQLLASAKAASTTLAREKYCWERQTPILLESVEKALQS